MRSALIVSNMSRKSQYSPPPPKYNTYPPTNMRKNTHLRDLQVTIQQGMHQSSTDLSSQIPMFRQVGSGVVPMCVRGVRGEQNSRLAIAAIAFFSTGQAMAFVLSLNLQLWEGLGGRAGG